MSYIENYGMADLITELLQNCFERNKNNPRKFIVEYLSQSVEKNNEQAEDDPWQNKLNDLSAAYGKAKKVFETISQKDPSLNPFLASAKAELAKFEQNIVIDFERIMTFLSEFSQIRYEGSTNADSVGENFEGSNQKQNSQSKLVLNDKSTATECGEQKEKTPDTLPPSIVDSGFFTDDHKPETPSPPLKRLLRDPKANASRQLKQRRLSQAGRYGKCLRMKPRVNYDELSLGSYEQGKKRKICKSNSSTSSEGSDYQNPNLVKRKRFELKTFQPSSSETSSNSKSTEISMEGGKPEVQKALPDSDEKKKRGRPKKEKPRTVSDLLNKSKTPPTRAIKTEMIEAAGKVIEVSKQQSPITPTESNSSDKQEPLKILSVKELIKGRARTCPQDSKNDLTKEKSPAVSIEPKLSSKREPDPKPTVKIEMIKRSCPLIKKDLTEEESSAISIEPKSSSKREPDPKPSVKIEMVKRGAKVCPLGKTDKFPVEPVESDSSGKFCFLLQMLVDKISCSRVIGKLE